MKRTRELDWSLGVKKLWENKIKWSRGLYILRESCKDPKEEIGLIHSYLSSLLLSLLQSISASYYGGGSHSWKICWKFSQGLHQVNAYQKPISMKHSNKCTLQYKKLQRYSNVKDEKKFFNFYFFFNISLSESNYYTFVLLILLFFYILKFF